MKKIAIPKIRNHPQTNSYIEKISIIIPVYNVKPYLHECLESVLNQTYQNLEIILVDDGSTDGSGKICDEYNKKYSSIKTYHKTNEGLGLTRNFGVSKATGKYIMFIDSDDYIANDMVEVLYHTVKKTNSDLCKCGFTKVTHTHNIYNIRQYKNQLYSGKQVIKEYLPKLFGSSPTEKDSIEMCACMTLYNSDIIKKYNIKFPSERQCLSEDIFFNVEFAQYATRVAIIEYTGYYYRLNEHSLSKSYLPDRFEKSVQFYNELKKILTELNLYSVDNSLRLSRLFFVYIRVTLSQENPKISHLANAEMKNNLKEICYNEIVQATISEYPIHKLGFKQKLFLTLLKHKKIKFITVLIKLGII